MRKAVEIRQLDRLPLWDRELGPQCQSRIDLIASARAGGRCAPGAHLPSRVGCVDISVSPGAPSHDIDRTAASHRRDPRRGRASVWVKPVGSPPHLQEGIGHRLFSIGRIPQDETAQGERQSGMLVVQLRERVCVAVGNGIDEGRTLGFRIGGMNGLNGQGDRHSQRRVAIVRNVSMKARRLLWSRL